MALVGKVLGGLVHVQMKAYGMLGAAQVGWTVGSLLGYYAANPALNMTSVFFTGTTPASIAYDLINQPTMITATLLVPHRSLSCPITVSFTGQ